eukprot:1067549-Prymnesium_polylepis.1
MLARKYAYQEVCLPVLNDASVTACRQSPRRSADGWVALRQRPVRRRRGGNAAEAAAAAPSPAPVPAQTHSASARSH